MSDTSVSNPPTTSRWIIAIAAFCMQLALGAVYAWSTFLPAVIKVYDASRPVANANFSIILAVLGITAGFGGYLNSRFGPRAIATTAGLLYGIGTILSSFAAPHLFVLYITDGLIGGVGLGLGYIVAIAMLIKWFPDRRGFITGLAVAGFGGGAAITAPIAAALIGSATKLSVAALTDNLHTTFLILGIIYLVVVIVAAQFFRAAPDGYAPSGWTPSSRQQEIRTTHEFTLKEALVSPRWYTLWFILALNVTAGAALISVASPLATAFTGVTTVVAATLVTTLSIFNGVGRLFWGWLSDAIGRPYTFLSIFIVQIIAFVLTPLIHDFALLFLPVALIGLCYGGGFGTMPAFAGDFFGPKNSGVIYGTMLTAWSAGGIIGPLLITSFGTTAQPDYVTPLYIITGILVVSCALPFYARFLAHQKSDIEVSASS